MRLIALSLTLAVIATLAPAAQQQPAQGPTFRTEVSFVELDAVVTGRDGAFVRGLTKDDFEVIEDGKPQTIAAFSVVDLGPPSARPEEGGRPRPLPDVRSNEGTFNGRVIVLVLDDVLVDPRRTNAVRTSARQFINRFVGDNDLVAVVSTSGQSKTSQNFTTNRELLLASVNNFMGGRIPSIATTRLENLRNGGTGVDTDVLQRAERTKMALGRLSDASDYLAGIRGRRKALIWFTEGVDFDPENVLDHNAADVNKALSTLIASAQAAGVSFYAVDPRGLGAGLDEAITVQFPADRDVTKDFGMQSVFNEIRWTQGSMRTISNETGGFAIIGGDLNEQFSRVIAENSSYYLLGYYPSTDRKDGKLHTVQVKVKRPGLQVRHRKGYTVPKATPARATSSTAAGAPPELRAGIESPIPLAGVPMRVFAAPFKGTSKAAAVAIIVEVSPAGLRFERKGEVFSETLDLLIVPVNAEGKALHGARDEAPLNLSEKGHELVRANGLRLARRLDLPPGRYQLHVAARSGNSKAVGALLYDLEVPDFSKLPLAMSGLAVISTSADRMPTPRPEKSFTDVLPMAATAVREFERADTLFGFVDVYANVPGGTAHAVQLHTTVTRDDGTVAFRRTDERAADELKKSGGTLPHSMKLPLAGLTPGRYVLRVEARSYLGGGAQAAREVEFTVR